jgi:hypothetical protein
VTIHEEKRTHWRRRGHTGGEEDTLEEKRTHWWSHITSHRGKAVTKYFSRSMCQWVKPLAVGRGTKMAQFDAQRQLVEVK